MKKKMGWTLFACGILGIVFVFSSPIGYILQSLTSLLELILSPKLWLLIPVGIALYYGWKLSHRDSTPGKYSLTREDTQEEVDISVFILKCIAERMGADESQGKSIVSFNRRGTSNFTECTLSRKPCGASDECYKIRKVVDRLLDRGLRTKERTLETN